MRPIERFACLPHSLTRRGFCKSVLAAGAIDMLAPRVARGSLVSHTTAASVTGNNVTTSGINTTGAGFLVLIVTQNQPPSGTLTDSKGNSWTGLTAQSPSGSGSLRMYYCLTPVVGTGHTFTWASTGQLPSIAVAAFSQSVVFDTQNGSAAGSSDSVTTGFVAPSAINALVITGAMDIAVGATCTVDSGFTITDATNVVAGVSYGTRLAYIEETTIVSKSATWQTVPSTSTDIAAVIASFVLGTPVPVSRHKHTIL